MLSIDKFPISENISATFSLNYLRIPFGEMTEQNVWIKYRRQLNGLFIHIPEHTHPLIPVELSLQEQQ